MVSVEILHFILLLYSTICFVFLFVIVCIFYTGVEPNFIVCITLSRHILIINPELISSNQDTRTNRVTTWQTYYAPSEALA